MCVCVGRLSSVDEMVHDDEDEGQGILFYVCYVNAFYNIIYAWNVSIIEINIWALSAQFAADVQSKKN